MLSTLHYLKLLVRSDRGGVGRSMKRGNGDIRRVFHMKLVAWVAVGLFLG